MSLTNRYKEEIDKINKELTDKNKMKTNLENNIFYIENQIAIVADLNIRFEYQDKVSMIKNQIDIVESEIKDMKSKIIVLQNTMMKKFLLKNLLSFNFKEYIDCFLTNATNKEKFVLRSYILAPELTYYLFQHITNDLLKNNGSKDSICIHIYFNYDDINCRSFDYNIILLKKLKQYLRDQNVQLEDIIEKFANDYYNQNIFISIKEPPLTNDENNFATACNAFFDRIEEKAKNGIYILCMHYDKNYIHINNDTKEPNNYNNSIYETFCNSIFKTYNPFNINFFYRKETEDWYKSNYRNISINTLIESLFKTEQQISSSKLIEKISKTIITDFEDFEKTGLTDDEIIKLFKPD